MNPVVILGGGPAGLMAAEVIASAGRAVTVYDHMSSVGRKFLMAGRGGLNLTHSEPLEPFLERYGAAALWMGPVIRRFPPEALRDWCHGLGQPTFVGSSGRVFPVGLKALPLLRAWLRRLDGLGVRFAMKRKWIGWDAEGALLFTGPDGVRERVEASATLLALGGASWPRLGSDGSWVGILEREGISIAPLAPANCGFIVPWSDVFRQKFEGQPLKAMTMTFGERTIQGEAMVTAQGLEGGPLYALSSRLRAALAAEGVARLEIDLRAGLSHEELAARLGGGRGSQSFSNFLRKQAGLSPVAIGLLYETTQGEDVKMLPPYDLAQKIKACSVRLTATTSLARAISTAGGIAREALDENFMLRQKRSVFAAGEMLDWDAPTGGYLLQGTFSTAVAAAQGVLKILGDAG